MALEAKAEKTQTLMVRKTIRARRERVFEAWTKPELMQQWLVRPNGRSETSIDLRVGGRYENNMYANPDDEGACVESGRTASGEKIFKHFGEYLEIVPPERLVFTWNSATVQNTRVTVELRSVGEGTEVTILHELFATEQDRQAHTEGWEVCLEQLATLLAYKE